MNPVLDFDTYLDGESVVAQDLVAWVSMVRFGRWLLFEGVAYQCLTGLACRVSFTCHGERTSP